MTSPRALSLKGLLGRLTCLYLSCFVVFTYFNSQLHASFDLGELGNSDRTTGSFFFFFDVLSNLQQFIVILSQRFPVDFTDHHLLT